MQINPKIVYSIVGSTLLGAVVITPAVVYGAGEMTWIKNKFRDLIVKPNLPLFETFNKQLDKTHQQYNENKNLQRISRGKPPKEEDAPKTPDERADAISNTTVKSAVGLGSDFVATYALQRGLDKMLKNNSSPAQTLMVDAAITLGSIIAMPTLFAKQSEYVHHQIIRKGILQKVFGMDKQRAEDVSSYLTYVGLPSMAAAIGSVIVAHRVK